MSKRLETSLKDLTEKEQYLIYALTDRAQRAIVLRHKYPEYHELIFKKILPKIKDMALSREINRELLRIDSTLTMNELIILSDFIMSLNPLYGSDPHYNRIMSMVNLHESARRKLPEDEETKIKRYITLLEELEKMPNEALGEGLRSELDLWKDNMEYLLQQKRKPTEEDQGAIDVFYGIKEYYEEYENDYDPLMAEMGMYRPITDSDSQDGGDP